MGWNFLAGTFLSTWDYSGNATLFVSFVTFCKFDSGFRGELGSGFYNSCQPGRGDQDEAPALSNFSTFPARPTRRNN